jgi:hypothetical protein
VPRLVTDVDLTLDGEVFRARTNAGDQLSAERAVGENPQNKPMDQMYHVYYFAFRRRHPDHPCAKAYGRFVEALEAFDEVDADAEREDESGPLATRTLEAGSDT